MLNYIWAGLIIFAMVFALSTDISDLRNDVYRNGKPLGATIKFRAAPDANAKESQVDLVVNPDEYAKHFGINEKLSAAIPAVLSRLDSGYQVRVAKDAALPPRLATMRDQTDAKELQARVVDLAITDATATANLLFPPIRFVKLRAITQAAIDMAGTAVDIGLKLIGVLTLWLGLMKIAEACGLIGAMVKVVQPILRPLFPSIPRGHPAMGYIAVNLAGNILGLGNATTAMGLKAMEELQKLNPTDDTATDAMVMLLAIHTAAFQLVPSAALVAVMGFGAAEVFIPMLIVGFVATVIAAIAAKLLGYLPMYRRTNPDHIASSSRLGEVEVAV
jgi:spore maturation protein A